MRFIISTGSFSTPTGGRRDDRRGGGRKDGFASWAFDSASGRALMPKGALEGKVALVTGGRGGIGRAIVSRFLREGAKVYAADLSERGSLAEPSPAESASAERPPAESAPEDRSPAESDSDDGFFVRFDATAEADAIAAMERVGREQGKLDVLVNAAGIEIEKTIEETSLEEWNRCFAVNVTGTFLASKHALPLMRKAADEGIGASIVNFGSYDGFIADPGLAAYCASKGAVHALTRAMACDHGPEGVRVNAICPGYVDTPMLESFFSGEGSGAGGESPERIRRAVKEIHPTRTFGTPEDVANLVNWLASDEARYASGQLWILDGGLTAQVQQMRL